MLTQTAGHGIDREHISENAVAVVEMLRDAGFAAYLVGGCIRDLLLGRTPKDFDVATDATPEDVREVFPRVRLVGRRFRIAHVRMRREIIEVSTFRRTIVDGGDTREHRPHLSEHGVILHDNVYGTIDEDAFRRDFTVNALYYDPVEHRVLDYCDGMADIASRTLRLIGDPRRRLREDPVRILRAIRFAAKLDLKMHPDTENAIAPMCEMLAAIPPARLFDEFLKLFLAGHGVRAFDLLQQYDLTEILFPLPSHGEDIVRLALASTDARVKQTKPVTPGFLLAAFLWHEYLDRSPPLAALHGDGSRDEQDAAASAVLAAQQSIIAIPRRHGYFVREVWGLQPRLERLTAGNVAKVLEHRRFRAAYDFLMLRVEAEDVPAELGDWWTDAQVQEPEELMQKLPLERSRRRRRRRRYRRNGANGTTESARAVANGGARPPQGDAVP